MKDNRQNAPTPPNTGGRLASWGAIATLFGAGALPCPGCGVPLAWHLWPLAGLLLIARLIRNRHPAAPMPEKTSVEMPACATDEKAVSQNENS